MAVKGTVASRTNVGELLKPIFDDEIQELKSEFKFLKDAKKLADNVELDGEDFVIEVQTGRNARGENTLISDVLPDSGAAKFKQGKLRVARYFQPLQIDNELIMLADRKPATFSERCEILYRDSKNQMLRECNRQLLGDGTGTLATLTATLTGGAATATATVDSTRFLEEDMLLDIWIASGTTQRNTPPAYFRVDSIASATSVVLSMTDGSNVPTGGVSTDIIVKKGALYVSGTRQSKEFNGLQQITKGNDSFMGIDGSTLRNWRPNRYNASTKLFGPMLAGLAIVQGKRLVGALDEDKPDVIYASPEQTLAMVYGTNSPLAKVQFSRADLTKVGVSYERPTVNLGWGDIAVESDIDLPTDKVFAFNSGALIYGELDPLGLEEWDGVSVLPATDTTATATGIVAAQKMWFSWRMNVGCRRRNAFTEIYGLGAPTAP
jgi:hypothetical protein